MGSALEKLEEMDKQRAREILQKVASLATGESERLEKRLGSKSQSFGGIRVLEATAFPSSLRETADQMAYNMVMEAAEKAEGDPKTFAESIESIKQTIASASSMPELGKQSVQDFGELVERLLKEAGAS